jgi:uncharacterized C2H2 Zn-finger protein
MCKKNFYDRAEVLLTAAKVLCRDNILCPICGRPLSLHGSYKRHVKDGYGQRHDGWVAQLHCSACNTYPALIPNFIMPYKHYKVEVIEAVIVESEEDGLELSSCPADTSTIRRWVNQFEKRGVVAIGWLASILFSLFGRHVNIMEQQNKSLLGHLAYLLHQIHIPEAGEVIARANIVLTRYDHGFL